MNFNETVLNAKQSLAVSEGGQSPNHSKLLQLVKQLKTKGSDSVADRRADFDAADINYKSYRAPDDDDTKAKESGEPIKIYYPITFAQTLTMKSTLMAILMRDPFFELMARRPDFVLPAKLVELDLQYQLDRNNFYMTLDQCLLDMAKYGFASIGVGFEQTKSWVRTYPTGVMRMITNMLGIDASTDKEIVSYEGSVLLPNDPYNFMWDTEVSIGDLQRGQFVFTRQYYMSQNELTRRTNPSETFPQGEFFNVDRIPELGRQTSDTTTPRGGLAKELAPFRNPVKGANYVLVDECYVKLVPNQYGLSDLGQEQMWKIVMANECRIIQAEPSRFEHGKFPVTVFEYAPDLRSPTNDGLIKTIEGMQEWINWLLNSHQDNVRRVITNQAIFDPQYIPAKELESKATYIPLLRSMHGRSIGEVFQQLKFDDVTQEHVKDATSIFQILQRVTGISDNLMGMQLPTQRSATEVLNMQRMGAGRLRYLAQTIFYQGLRPLAEMMIANTQQFCTQPRFMRLAGPKAMAMGIDPARVIQGFLSVSPEEIQGAFDVVPIDPLSPQDKNAMAGTLGEVLGMIMQSGPMGIALTGAHPSQFLNQILSLRGIVDTQDFISPPTQDQRARLLALLMGSQGGGKGDAAAASRRNGDNAVSAQVKPDEEIARQVAAGNLVPVQSGIPQGGM